jgi:hypothetical protein
MPKVADNAENMGKCICSGCPSYNDCMRDGKLGLFCAKGKADCEITKNGCLCGACPVASEYRLDKMYYCITGVEA